MFRRQARNECYGFLRLITAVTAALLAATSCSTPRESRASYQLPTERSVPPDKEAAIEQALDDIVFPSVDLQEVTIQQLVLYVQQNARAYDPNDRGLSLMVQLRPHGPAEKTFNLRGTQLSLRDVISMACRKLDLRWRICGYQLFVRVVIAPENVHKPL